MEVRHGVKGSICADHDDVAVCEVQKQDNTVDHAVAKCHQRVDRACLEAIEQLREQQGQDVYKRQLLGWRFILPARGFHGRL